MAVGLVPDVGEEYLAKVAVNVALPEPLVCRLYKNDITPASSMTVADYTEATFTGYSAVTLSSSSWTVTPNAPTVAQYDISVPFVCAGTTSEDIYGYYLSTAASSTLLCSERFDSVPRRISWPNDALRPRPKILLGLGGGFLLEDGSGYIMTESSGAFGLEG